MLRMSKLADYAFIILAQMMVAPEENWAASALAEKTTLPLPTVAKLMKLLAKGQIVSAQRGASGGYRLAMNATCLSVVHVIEAVDGPISLTECSGDLIENHNCACAMGTHVCPVKESWKRVNRAIMEALSTVKLSEFAAAGKPG